jgi:TrmH family RNA methyltransferase
LSGCCQHSFSTRTVISSTANAHVKSIRSLSADRRERQRERSFVLEGVRLVSEALHAGARPRLVLYAPEQLQQTEAGTQLLHQLDGTPGCYQATARVVSAACDTVSSQGVVAVLPWPEQPARPGLLLVLDVVQDPGNVGTLLRSAEAAGVGQVVCSRGTADVYSPKVVRSAMGAHFYLPVHVDVNRDDLTAWLRQVPNVYAAVGSASTPYYAVDWHSPAALIIGNEAQGIDARMLALASQQIAIPMVGRTESLNAAVAGSIILFETLRQKMERL